MLIIYLINEYKIKRYIINQTANLIWETMIVFEEDYLRIEIDENLRAVVMNWKSTPTSLKLREGLHKGLNELVSRKYACWIENMSKLSSLDLEDQVWINGIWIPKTMMKGVRIMAIICSKDIYWQNRIEEMIGSPKRYKGFESRYFPNMEDGKAWISSLNLHMLN